MKLELFHSIADAASAEVRRALVQKSLTESVNFRNVAYESHVQALKEATGGDKVPTLRVDGATLLKGKEEILAWLATK